MAMIGSAALAQSGGVNSYSAVQLQQMAHKLEMQPDLKTTGSVTEPLDTYSNHSTMLTVRTKSGGAELHEHFSDIFFVLDGNATLTTGGTIAEPHSVSAGETRGTSVQGGMERKLGKGDVVHISPNTPHQLSLANGQSLTYFVVKVRE